MTDRLKVMTILGTRPEIIRLARVMALLDQETDHVLVHTGQNSDYELNDVFFEDLRVRKPDHFLNISRASLGNILGQILVKTEEALVKERPDAVLILGDTNSAIGAIIARRMKIPVYHMEAGNRCFDFNVPEEINRRIVDHVSDFNLVYSEHARRNLLNEGIHPRKIYLTGSPMREVLDDNGAGFLASDVLERLELKQDGYFLVSMHRAENVDIPANLTSLLNTLNRLAEEQGLPVIVSTHPRTRDKMDKLGGHPLHSGVRFLKPFGFHDYINLQMNSRCTLSDSGTISEESSILGFPAITFRTAMERPEAMDTGSIVLTGLDSDTILSAVKMVIANHQACSEHAIPDAYSVTNTSYRVVKLILGTTKLAHKWDGIVE